MAGKPEFFWRPPDGARIVAMTTFEGLIVIATDNGVYTIGDRFKVIDEWVVQKINATFRQF